jgi:hypothetical protein
LNRTSAVIASGSEATQTKALKAQPRLLRRFAKANAKHSLDVAMTIA